MQIVIGIDDVGDRTAPDLVKRLRFTNPSFDLTYVIPPSPRGEDIPYAGPPLQARATFAYLQEHALQEQGEAKNRLQTASDAFKSEPGERVTTLLNGKPLEKLLEHAEVTDTDLIAVNAAHQGPVLAFLTGSVARGLVIGAHQSVLLARPNPHEENVCRPLRAVLATDHSAYMEECIQQFIRFRPRGLVHLTVLTSYPRKEIQAMERDFAHLAVPPSVAVRNDLEERNDTLVQRLRDAFQPFPITITSRVSGESIDCAISQTMEETESNLLILGAQGHGFLDRLTLGSVSFKQAMTAPYSVLVLRVNSEEKAKIRAAKRVMNTLLLPVQAG